MNIKSQNAIADDEKLGVTNISNKSISSGCAPIMIMRVPAVVAMLFFGLVFPTFAGERHYFSSGHGEVSFHYRQGEWEWNF